MKKEMDPECRTHKKLERGAGAGWRASKCWRGEIVWESKLRLILDIAEIEKGWVAGVRLFNTKMGTMWNLCGVMLMPYTW
jgi:hypothetical protein